MGGYFTLAEQGPSLIRPVVITALHSITFRNKYNEHVREEFQTEGKKSEKKKKQNKKKPKKQKTIQRRVHYADKHAQTHT